MGVCYEDLSISGGAFQGCMIGLSIGLVMGTIRAISLSGIPHPEDETPCKTFIFHILGGVVAGSLIGIVHAFLTHCIFPRN
ncbi:UNVERIFIED_CONTAM: hypothetical protein PYX00_008303 [Menopon gallinae]|uniref:Uncharacterized protein n=1 Tax=Menopon gallinae TaxID=328185 RepID=A0AAW2HMF3_9NEOP